MQLRRMIGFAMLALLCSVPWTGLRSQERPQGPTDACPKHPNTLRAMRNCYRALVVFAPSLDHPQMKQEFDQLKAGANELRARDVMYVPVIPEGHNQPVPPSRVPTARLSEDELAAVRHHFQVESEDFLVVLIGEDGEQKLSKKTPVSLEELDRLIDSMPKRKREMNQTPQGEQ
jgi:hypothetical protein